MNFLVGWIVVGIVVIGDLRLIDEKLVVLKSVVIFVVMVILFLWVELGWMSVVLILGIDVFIVFKLGFRKCWLNIVLLVNNKFFEFVDCVFNWMCEVIELGWFIKIFVFGK